VLPYSSTVNFVDHLYRLQVPLEFPILYGGCCSGTATECRIRSLNPFLQGTSTKVSIEADYLEAFEVHSPEGIRQALAAGASATKPIKGKTPMDSLIVGYLRSPQFGACIRVLLDAGAAIDDPLLKAVLLDDEVGAKRLLSAPGEDVNRKLRIPCAFTSAKESPCFTSVRNSIR
jgi:hypothetical protein